VKGEARVALLAAAVFTLLAGCTRSAARDRGGADPFREAVPTAVVTVVDPRRAENSPAQTRQNLRFTDVSAQAGIRWMFANGATGRHRFVESTGGGIALLDYDNDGRLDIFCPQGGPVPGAATPVERNFPVKNVLYRNNGDGTFTDVTGRAGLGGPSGYGQGVAAADYDDDGWTDLYVTAYGGSHLFRNNGDGTFSDVTRRAGVADARSSDHPGEAPWPLSAAWGDYDRDGRLDLFVCHYARWTPALDRACPDPRGRLQYCRPQVYEPSVSRLYRNNGDGTFADVTQKSGIARLRGKSMGAVWCDYDDDAWPDLFVTNDTTQNWLLRNNHDGTFTDKGIVAGVAFGEQGGASSGMGIGVGDYDGDGREDFFVVNFAGEPKSVFRNVGNGLFEAASFSSNVASTALQYLGFGLECLDYDLDGRRDFLVGNGHVLDLREPDSNGSTYAQSQQLFRNTGDGRFAEDLRSLGDLARPRVTRGLAVGDCDNDGDVDAVMVSQTGPLQLFRNDGGNANRWITLRLEGGGPGQSNRDAIGAKVSVRTAGGKRQTQEVRSGSSYCSRSDTRLTFGLGSAPRVESLEVRWPSGRRQIVNDPLAANRFYHVREGGSPAPDPRVPPL